MIRPWLVWPATTPPVAVPVVMLVSDAIVRSDTLPPARTVTSPPPIAPNPSKNNCGLTRMFVLDCALAAPTVPIRQGWSP